jgi:hypothetical protein
VRPDRISSPMTSMAAVTISLIWRLRRNDPRQITQRPCPGNGCGSVNNLSGLGA